MLVEMIPGSNHTLTLSRKGTERNCCVLHRQQKSRSEKICHFSGSRTKDQKPARAPCLRTCLKFCFKDRATMEQREAPVDSHAEGTERRLRELASKWFIETQVPLIVHNGFFPTWFQGFITRKDAEEILRGKELGCFLIRLSEKVIGYILSYKGTDRCRHFVINQVESGQFVVCGDTEGHDTVSDLIEYYKTSPIEPFGDYLTSSCFEVLNEELYDVIQVSPRGKRAAAVRDVKNTQKQQVNSASEQPPTRPPKGNRTAEVPQLPRRSRHLDSGLLNDQDRVMYAQLRKQSPREIPRFQHICQDKSPGRAERSKTQELNISRCSPPPGPDSQLGLLYSKSRSLPLLDNSSDNKQSYRLSSPPHTPPRLSPRPTTQAACCPPPERTDSCSRTSSNHTPEYVAYGAIYHLAGWPGSPHVTPSEARSLTSQPRGESVYAEVSGEALVGRFPHGRAYEPIPGSEDAAHTKPSSNTYEPLEDCRPKHNHPSWGLKNDKWKWVFPEAKRKW